MANAHPYRESYSVDNDRFIIRLEFFLFVMLISLNSMRNIFLNDEEKDILQIFQVGREERTPFFFAYV